MARSAFCGGCKLQLLIGELWSKSWRFFSSCLIAFKGWKCLSCTYWIWLQIFRASSLKETLHLSIQCSGTQEASRFGAVRYWRECDLIVFLFGICMFWRHVCSTAYTQLPGNCISVGNLLSLVHGTKYMAKSLKCWLNIIEYWLNKSKTIKYMSKMSRNILSESNNKLCQTMQGGGVWGACKHRGDI